MKAEVIREIKDTAFKLEAIYLQSPTEYAYIKGWIHCLMETEKRSREALEAKNKGYSSGW